ncbi:MAG: hybrid sensor histidine kinase/response regulator [Prochloraceae cyanobacterium]|nr:hybrid sensor histidine kinase/response regulator [Prochloraceae cyanobacterium]
MCGNSLKILLIEDNLAEARLLQEFLKVAERQKFSMVHVQRLQEALKRLDRDYFDVILLDLTLPDSQGLASLQPLMRLAPSLPIVVLTNTNDDSLAIEAVRQGAQDYLVKRQIRPELLIRSLCYAIERKQAQETLRKENEALETAIEQATAEMVKAKEVDRLRSEFLSMLSHDFRNPMNAILLSSGLLLKREHLLSKEKKLAHFQLIRSAIKNMDRMLDECLLIGRADSGKLECQLVPLDLELFCRSLVEEFRLSNDGNEIDIAFTCFGELKEVLCDRDLLRHILSNLLANAIKYSPFGGKIDFSAIEQDKTVVFYVRDRGIGIPLEEQKQLFEPFYRASNVDTIAGSGLGLAIVKKCVELHSGEISVESQVGVGTTFTVTLPLRRGAFS